MPEIQTRVLPPLPERMRPKSLSEYVGQRHLIGEGCVLRRMIDSGNLSSFILWGPPGVGKTTLARIISTTLEREFYTLSAVSAGVKDVREVIDKARSSSLFSPSGAPVLFIDEIHRFNKAQQYALIGAVEAGTVVLVGATTENPSFEVISPLLSRCQVFVLKSLDADDLDTLLHRAISTDELLSKRDIEVRQTGALFRDFDETSRKGVLERLQKEERIPVDRRDRERVSRAESVISAHTKIWAAEEVQNALKAAAAVQDRQAEITPPAGMQGSEAEPSKEYADLPKEPEMIRAEEQLTEEPARRPEQAAPQANLPEQMPERLPADLPGRMPETAAVPLPEKTAEPERVEEKAPAPEPERKIERMPEPERKIERMPEPAEEKAAVSEPERIEEETPVPEPEREPEKAPETKKEPAEAEKRGTVKEGPDGGRKNGRALGERSLTGAEKRLFASFVPTKGAMKRLVAALDQISLAAYTGNLILTGEPGSDTAELAKNVIKDLKAKQPDFSGKVARVTGSALSSSRKRPEELVEKLAGGALMVEKAGEISGTCMKKLLEGLNQESWGVLIILIDTKRRIGKLLEENPEMASYFNARFDVEALDNSTLAAYGCQYARMQEYSIDELGRLALHTRIEDMQTSDHIVTVKDVREIVDEAIDHAERKTPKHLLDVLFSRRYDENNMIILHEGDFI